MRKNYKEGEKIKYIYYSNLMMDDILELYQINNNIIKEVLIVAQNKEILYEFYSATYEYRYVVTNKFLYDLSEKKLIEGLNNMILEINPNTAYLNSLNANNSDNELNIAYKIKTPKKFNSNRFSHIYKIIGLCVCVLAVVLISTTLYNHIKLNFHQFVPVKQIKVSNKEKEILNRKNLSLREAINTLPAEKPNLEGYKEYTNKYLSMKLKYPSSWEVRENISTIQNLVRESKSSKLFDLASDKAKLAGILVEFIAHDPFETKISVGVSPLECNMNIQSLSSILDDNIVQQIDKQIRTNIQAEGNKIISSKGSKIKKIDKNEVILSEYTFRSDKKNSNDTSVIQIICPNGLNNIVLTAVSRDGENLINKYNILYEMLKTLGAYDTNKELIEVG